MKKISFVLSHIPDPRMYRRIIAFKKEFDVSVICIRRTNQDLFVQKDLEGVNHYVKDIYMPPQSKIFKRVKASRKYQQFILDVIEEINPNIIYTEGLDSLIAIKKYSLSHNVKVIYEVADLRECYLKEEPKSLFRKIIDTVICKRERSVFDCVTMLVVTSMKFYDLHYKDFFPKEKVFFLPNMPELNAFNSYQSKVHNAGFTVGFIGGLRYLKQMYLLVDAAKEAKVDVVIAGGVVDSANDAFIEYCSSMSNVKIIGRYNYDNDIARLYGMMDVIYAVYEADNANVRIALPNKLYEAIYCGLPIIVAKTTYLSEVVKEWNVGVAVSHKDKKELVQELIKLRDDYLYYNNFVSSCNKRHEDMDINIYLNRLVNIVANFK